MAAKPHLQPTPKLTVKASRNLVRAVGAVTLTAERREVLQGYAVAARSAFERPLPSAVELKK